MGSIQEQKPPEDNVQAKPSTEDVELNEAQLEIVAGGVYLNSGIIGKIIDIFVPNIPTF